MTLEAAVALSLDVSRLHVRFHYNIHEAVEEEEAFVFLRFECEVIFSQKSSSPERPAN